MLRRKLRRNLGVSTVIANLLMIMITLSLAAILVAWAGTTYGAFSGGAQLFFLQRGQAMQERFVIEFVNTTRTGAMPNSLDIFVRNVGAEQINIVAIYVNGTSIGTFLNSPSRTVCPPGGGALPSEGQLMPVGGICDFRFQWSHGWSSGNVINIVVASSRGNQASYTVRGS
jgi:hypothetical protein